MTKHIATRIAEALAHSNRSVRALARVLTWLLSFHRYGRKATVAYTVSDPENVYFVFAKDIIGDDQRTGYVTGRTRASFKARYFRGLLVLRVL